MLAVRYVLFPTFKGVTAIPIQLQFYNGLRYYPRLYFYATCLYIRAPSIFGFHLKDLTCFGPLLHVKPMLNAKIKIKI